MVALAAYNIYSAALEVRDALSNPLTHHPCAIDPYALLPPLDAKRASSAAQHLMDPSH